jgi:hypothetical protein
MFQASKLSRLGACSAAFLRSLCIYYGNRRGRGGMDRLYGQFVRPGDLVFDIGAHVGDRVANFRRLGARVVAAELQPALVVWLSASEIATRLSELPAEANFGNVYARMTLT